MQQFKYQEQRTDRHVVTEISKQKLAWYIVVLSACSKSLPGVLSDSSTMRQFHASSIRYDLLTNGSDIRKYWVCRREERLYKIDARWNENSILDAFHFSLSIARGEKDVRFRS
jgi:hypothetical protein